MFGLLYARNQGGRNGFGSSTAKYKDISFPIAFKDIYNVYITDTMSGTGNTETTFDGVLMWAYLDSTKATFRICVSSTAIGVFNWIAFGN